MSPTHQKFFNTTIFFVHPKLRAIYRIITVWVVMKRFVTVNDIFRPLASDGKCVTNNCPLWFIKKCHYLPQIMYQRRQMKPVIIRIFSTRTFSRCVFKLFIIYILQIYCNHSEIGFVFKIEYNIYAFEKFKIWAEKMQ